MGLLVAVVGAAWLWVSCGFPPGVGAARASLAGSFDRLDAALPLALVLAGGAIWMIAVPLGEALGGERRDWRWHAIAACAVPVVGFVLGYGIVGGLVARDPMVAGWSPWQDVVAQFCLPVGGLAAVACGAMALFARDGWRLACWVSASSGGLALMALGRADDGGMAAAAGLAAAQWPVLAAWILAVARDPMSSGWRAWLGGACAASLAGIWPLPGGLARWRHLEESLRGGFGASWDAASLTAVILAWLMSVAAWGAWTWRAARAPSQKLQTADNGCRR